jgi:hypothetical protein
MGDIIYDLNYLNNTDLKSDKTFSDFNSNLKVVNSSLIDLKNTQDNAIMEQTKIKSLLDNENTRLNTKKDEIDKAYENQKRIIYFNDNSRKKYAAYLKIIITIVITLFILFLLYRFSWGVIPEYIITILIILTVGIGFIISMNYYFIIISRDNYNFDELNFGTLPLPNKTDKNDIIDSSKLNQFNLPTNLACVGETCCSPPTMNSAGTKWNSELGKCLFSPALSTEPTPTPTQSTLAPTSTPTQTTR